MTTSSIKSESLGPKEDGAVALGTPPPWTPPNTGAVLPPQDPLFCTAAPEHCRAGSLREDNSPAVTAHQHGTGERRKHEARFIGGAS